MISGMLSNKKLNPIVTKLFFRSRKSNIPLIFIAQSYFSGPKNIRLNSTCYFIMKIPNKWELQQTAFNHSSDIEFKALWIFFKNVLQNDILFLVIDVRLGADNLSERIF